MVPEVGIAYVEVNRIADDDLYEASARLWVTGLVRLVVSDTSSTIDSFKSNLRVWACCESVHAIKTVNPSRNGARCL